MKCGIIFLLRFLQRVVMNIYIIETNDYYPTILGAYSSLEIAKERIDKIRNHFHNKDGDSKLFHRHCECPTYDRIKEYTVDYDIDHEYFIKDTRQYNRYLAKNP